MPRVPLGKIKGPWPRIELGDGAKLDFCQIFMHKLPRRGIDRFKDDFKIKATGLVHWPHSSRVSLLITGNGMINDTEFEGRREPSFNQGSETARLFHSIDWSAHPLGSLGSWPAALKTSLGIIFNSQHPMFIWWGTNLYQFYNDGYKPSFGHGNVPYYQGEEDPRKRWPAARL